MTTKCAKCNGAKIVKCIGGIYADCDACHGVGSISSPDVIIPVSPNDRGSPLIEEASKPIKLDNACDSLPKTQEAAQIYPGKRFGRPKTKTA